VRWIAWLFVAACSGGSSAPAHPAPIPTTTPPATEAAPSEAECDALITHAVALGIDEAAGTQPTTQADHEAVRRGLREDFMTGCRTLPRAALRCALAAPTLDALAACQRTPSSSTSNSNVAPGGMTPPAPLLP
jgi:hypothetical protein